MTLSSIARRTEKLVVDNSPSILTALAITGVVTTAILTGKATFRAAEILAEERVARDGRDKTPCITTQEKVKILWKNYIPAASAGVLTIACVVGANHIGTRRAAAVAAAFTISERAFEEYKDKVIERIGEKPEQKIRDEIAQAEIDRTPYVNNPVVVVGDGQVLCFDAFSGRYFNSTMETLRKAENDINFQILHNMYATLDEFYELIGLKSTLTSQEVGWNTQNLMDLRHSAVMSDDGRPCLSISYNYKPTRGFRNLH